jgi:serine/threonine protein kinase
MGDVSCFIHPRRKAPSLGDPCPSCGRPMSFPLDTPPKTIDGEAVEKALDRGFYSAVYKTRNPRTGRVFAVKVTPKQVYAPPDPHDQDKGGYGDRKDFEAESRLHAELSESQYIAGLLDWGPEKLDFGGEQVECYWTRMDYVEGRSLEQVAEDGPRSPREALQIALDLLSLVDEMTSRGVYHNDLHGRNAFLVDLPRERERREAVDSSVAVKVFDLGSAARGDAATPGQLEDGGRLTDLERVAHQILRMLAAYESRSGEISPADLRISSQLRRVAEFYCQTDATRLPTPRDMIFELRHAWAFAERPSRRPVRLESMGQHFNAQTMPASYARLLLHDPEGKWSQRISGVGPQLIAGMRGCGKTMLLRSLEWAARTYLAPGETANGRLSRLRDENYLGLFVSCASLLRTPRVRTVDAPLQRLFLCFAREVVRAVSVCELDETGEIRYQELEGFSDLLRARIDWYNPPANPANLVQLEAEVGAALQAEADQGRDDAGFNALDAFEGLASAARRLVDLWENKHLVFLLDDVSRRFLTSGDVDQLLAQFCLKSEHFGFKISTEARSQLLFTPGGEAAQLGRDYDIFDLGREVLDSLGGEKGVAFVEGVLVPRQERVEGQMPAAVPSDLLGRQTLSDLARAIRLEPGKAPVYWGIQALAAVCVGNVGEIVQMYNVMLDKAAGRPVTKAIQHETMTAQSERRLLAIAGQDPWLYAHAVAFAAASNRELRKSDPERLRQYTQVFVRILPEQKELFDQLLTLVDDGVLVFAGNAPRYKGEQEAPQLQFKLAFNKIFGLTHRVPLSMRDRFEPAAQDVASWLKEPRQSRLQPGPDDEAGDGATEAAETDVEGGRQDPASTSPPAPSALPEPPSGQQLSFSVLDERPTTALAHLHLTADCRELPLHADSLLWSESTVIAALGFEDRAVGAWRNAHAAGVEPGQVSLIRYPDRGRADEVIAMLDAKGSVHELYDVDPAAQTSTEPALLDLLAPAGRPVVLDVTSLTKPLIYSLVRHALRRDRQVHVLHTCAAEYEPAEERLRPALVLLEDPEQNFAEGFRLLDEATVGEGTGFEPMAIGPQTRDASQPSLLAAFMSLKLQRLQRLLDSMQVERLVAVASVHTSGERSLRSRAMYKAAEYLVTRYGGEQRQLTTLDGQGAYEILRELHQRYALHDAFNFEITLTGTKMQAVGAGMFASTASPAAVYYSMPAPATRDKTKFTHGTGKTRLYRLALRES